jgi:hypothetical protein
MKLPQLEYVRAGTLAQAVALLAAHGGEAKVIAGGQSLLTNPLGDKGSGEGGIVAVAAAPAPMGVAIHHLPLTPPRLWRLTQDARTGAPVAS